MIYELMLSWSATLSLSQNSAMSVTTERDGSSLGSFGGRGALGPGLPSNDLSDR